MELTREEVRQAQGLSGQTQAPQKANGSEQTTTASPLIISGAEMIANLSTNPERPLMGNILRERNIAILSGPPGVTKTYNAMELGISLASGTPYFGFPVFSQRRTLFVETEMSEQALANRLARRCLGSPPEKLYFASQTTLKSFYRAGNIEKKIEIMGNAVAAHGASVLILDTVNGFFRGKQSANQEEFVGAFFDRVNEIPGLLLTVLVRHEKKASYQERGAALEEPTSRVRGSGVFGDQSDLMMSLKQPSRAVRRFVLSFIKCRHSAAPEDISLWFDKKTERLIAIPLPIHLLLDSSKTRSQLLAEMEKRFDVSARLGDELINEQESYIFQSMEGHERVLSLDLKTLSGAAWFNRLIDGEKLLQGCISLPVSMKTEGGDSFPIVGLS